MLGKNEGLQLVIGSKRPKRPDLSFEKSYIYKLKFTSDKTKNYFIDSKA